MKQIIPCNEKLYAIYNLDEGDELKLPVLAFGLNELGYIIPLTFDGGSGLDEAKAENLDRYELEEDTRIEDALEGIETRLDDLEELQDTAEQLRECIGYERPARYALSGSKGFNFLRIGGTVYKD